MKTSSSSPYAVSQSVSTLIAAEVFSILTTEGSGQRSTAARLKLNFLLVFHHHHHHHHHLHHPNVIVKDRVIIITNLEKSYDYDDDDKWTKIDKILGKNCQ